MSTKGRKARPSHLVAQLALEHHLNGVRAVPDPAQVAIRRNRKIEARPLARTQCGKIDVDGPIAGVETIRLANRHQASMNTCLVEGVAALVVP